MEKKVLIIEDEESIREYMRFILENNGFIGFEAENGAEGVACFSKQNFDLVITDMVMPEMDGLKFIETIRRIAPQTAVVAISGAMSFKNLATEAGKCGADAVIQKPFTEIEFIKTICGCLKKTPL
jgi:YesN/AraC family two-component response regulator